MAHINKQQRHSRAEADAVLRSISPSPSSASSLSNSDTVIPRARRSRNRTVATRWSASFAFGQAIVLTLVVVTFSAPYLASATSYPTRGGPLGRLSSLAFAFRRQTGVAPGGAAATAATGTAADDGMTFLVTPRQREAILDPSSASSLTPDERDEFDALISDIRDTFETEGVVVIRGLLSEEQLRRLDDAGVAFMEAEAKGKKAVGLGKKGGPSHFTSIKFGPVFLSPPKPDGGTCQDGENDDDERLAGFREVSLRSPVPAFVANVLLDMKASDDDTDKDKTLRVLKDVFLAKGAEESYCGWHVDDVGFWPVQAYSDFDSPPPHSTLAPEGVNAWIAMDDILPNNGGGLAVAPRSHRASWKQQAYDAIGSIRSTTYPRGGYTTIEDAMKNLKTCNMAVEDEKLSATIDETKKIFDFKRGDVLFHTRWLFHRSVPVTSAGRQALGADGVIRRYSIRYEYGSARTLGGKFANEPAIVLDRANAERSLNDICEGSGLPWYPKCWPPEEVAEDDGGMYRLVTEKCPVAEKKRLELFEEVAKWRKEKELQEQGPGQEKQPSSTQY